MSIVGVCSARPNFVKLAAVHHAIQVAGTPFKHKIVHTGQHYDPLFSDVFFEQLNIPLPDENLGVHGGTREEVIAQTATAITPFLKKERPEILLVYGDVNGAVGAAQAAHALGIRIGHVEAGLRSFDMDMPEELNRIAIDKLSALLFCTEESGVVHLQKEQVHGQIHLVGNTMIDTLIRMQPVISVQEVSVDLPRFGIVTLHRPSNVDSADSLRSNIDFLNEIAEHSSLVLPVHHRLKAGLEQFDLRRTLHRNIHLIDPLGYLPFLRLVSSSDFILTDSGGLQEEATFLQKCCFTLRRNTERPSTIESGSNRLIDPAVPKDRRAVIDFALHSEAIDVRVPSLWDGHAGARIVDILAQCIL